MLLKRLTHSRYTGYPDRIMAAILAVLMCVSMLQISAFASDGTDIQESPENYTVTLNENEHITLSFVDASEDAAEEKVQSFSATETVRVSAIADEGFEVAEVILRDENTGEEIPNLIFVSKDTPEVYEFVMPSANVIVMADAIQQAGDADNTENDNVADSDPEGTGDSAGSDDPEGSGSSEGSDDPAGTSSSESSDDPADAGGPAGTGGSEGTDGSAGTEKVIAAFPFESQTLYSTKEEIEETIAAFPTTLDVTLIDGSTDTMAVTWSSLDDVANTDYDIYTFWAELPEGYVLADGLDEWNMPYIEVAIIFESSAPYRLGTPNWQAISSTTILDSEYGFSFNTLYKDIADGQGLYSKSTSVSWQYCDIGTQAWKNLYGVSTEAQVAAIEGGDHWVTPIDSSHPASYWCDGRIWFRWNNVGYYGGKAIDMKVTLVGIEQLSIVGSAGIFFVEDQPGVVLASTSGITHPTFRYEFFVHGTNTPVNVKGHATFFDLDAGQGLKLGENMIAGYYLNTGHLFVGSGSHANYLQASGSATTNDDTAGWLTALFSGTYFTVTFCVGSGQDNSTWVSPPGQNFADPNLGGAQAALFGFRGDSVGPFDTPNITKRVSATSVYTDQTFTYYLEIPIPLENSSYYYTGILIYDSVPTQLYIPNPSGIRIVDKTNNRDITDWFVNNSTQSVVSFGANPNNAGIFKSEFYGITIEVAIPVAVRGGVSASSWQALSISNNGRVVSNSAYLHVARRLIDNGASKIRQSNTVTTAISAKTQVAVVNGSSSWSSTSNNCSSSSEGGYTVRKVPAGDNVIYTFTPNSGYSLKSITVNGVPVDISGYGDTFSYTFSNIQGQENRILVEYELRPGYLEIQKSSAAPDITNGNSCYSLAGAVYGVYYDSACSQLVGYMTTDANGYCKSGELGLQTFYVKEVTAPQGYQLDTTVYPVTVSSGATATLNVQDEPANDPVGITLTKIQETPNDYIPSLEGAQFTVNYYAGQYTSVDQLPSSPTRSWVIETKAVTNGSVTKYFTMMNDTYKIGGDEFFYDSTGQVIVPLGTITIQETKAPVGYTTEGGYLNDSTGTNLADTNGIVLLNVTQDGLGGTGFLQGGNAYTKEEAIFRGCSITLTKKGAAGQLLEGAEFKLEILNPETGEYDYLETGTTGSNGQILFDELIFGTYRITELATVGSSSLLAEPIVVTLPVTTGSEAGTSTPTYTEDGTDYYCDISFTVQNGEIIMPHAGGIGVVPLICTGMCFLAISTLLLRRKRRLS